MKKLAVIFMVMFFLTCLPLGLMADDNKSQDKIPNYTEEQGNGVPIPNLTEDTEEKDLNPVEREIVKKDIIRSNKSTQTNVQVGQ